MKAPRRSPSTRSATACRCAAPWSWRACDFYAGIAQRASDDEVRILASQFAAEEREHIGWLESCLADCGPDDGAIDDPDPPLSQE